MVRMAAKMIDDGGDDGSSEDSGIIKKPDPDMVCDDQTVDPETAARNKIGEEIKGLIDQFCQRGIVSPAAGMIEIDSSTDVLEQRTKPAGEVPKNSNKSDPPPSSPKSDPPPSSRRGVDGSDENRQKRVEGPGLAKARLTLRDLLMHSEEDNPFYVNATETPPREILKALENLYRMTKTTDADVDNALRIRASKTQSEKEALNEFMKLYFDRGLWKRVIEASKKMPEIQDMNTESIYTMWSDYKAYLAGRMTTQSLAADMDFETVFDLLFYRDFTPKKIMSIGCGDGDDLRGLDKARKKIMNLAHFHQGNGRLSKAFINEQTVKASKNSEAKFDPDLMGIDLAEEFIRELAKHSIRGEKMDVCDPDFATRYGNVLSMKNSCDIVLGNLILDRLRDLETFCSNLEQIARPDGKTRFHYGIIFPFSNESDNLSDSRPKATFWKKEGDIREGWTDLAPENALPKIVIDLWRRNHNTTNITRQKYVVICPTSCLTAREMREIYEKDPSAVNLGMLDGWVLQKTCDILGIDNSKAQEQRELMDSAGNPYQHEIVPDDELVVLPKVYDLYKISGNIEL